MTTNIREYSEKEPVKIEPSDLHTDGRLVIYALNEGGYNSTSVDLVDVINWVKENKPELLR